MINATYYAGGGGYTPADMMQRDADWISPGVLSTQDLVVAQTTTASMNVTVSGAAQGQTGGNAWLPNGYRVFNDSLATLAIPAADTTNPRIDLVVIGIDTTATPYIPQVKVIKGTASASPSVPALPTGFVGISLARVRVNANVTSITNANITDIRTIAGLVVNSGGDKVEAILSDLMSDRIYYCGTTSGTNTYAVTNSEITAYTDGLTVRVKIGNASTGASTININGLGAKTILDTLGNSITSGGLKAGLPYHLSYNGTNFIVLGKGGGGDATAAQILLGKKATVDSGLVTGTLDLTNLVTDNIKSGVTINGVPGKSSVVDTSDATATSAQMLYNSTGYVNGSKITGTIPLANPDYVDQIPASNVTVGAASNDGQNYAYLGIPNNKYLNGVNWVRSLQPDLLAANILSGKNILGIAGSASRVVSGDFIVASGGSLSINLPFTPTIVILYNSANVGSWALSGTAAHIIDRETKSWYGSFSAVGATISATMSSGMSFSGKYLAILL
ncbi:hypothetical protein D2A34_21965 [Clostridium chromiireducens]|uniref:Uncharacterized protein n=1 Tax=Clostridium chromiireducens TaxID=225345 RepID=A0A399IIM5_9CLOT|nr:hypothetical protein [Clostridium chromiireducens]RII32864.1 hypothetical protein D2A34_21965 [Clostridium chromiireducens]